MKVILLILLFITILQSFGQEAYTWNGKEYFIYPDRVDHSQVGMERNYNFRWDSDYNYHYKLKNSIFHSKSKKLSYARAFFEDGIIPVLDPIPHGDYLIFYKKEKEKDEDKVAVTFSLQDNQPIGMAIWYDEEGQIIQKGQYKNGFKEGHWQVYTEKGNVVEDKNYQNGLLHGNFIKYYWNSVLIEEQLVFADGMADEEQLYYNKDGHLYSKETYHKGVALINETYSESGSVEYKTIFDTVRGNNIEVSYYENGKVRDSSIMNVSSPLGFYYLSNVYLKYILVYDLDWYHDSYQGRKVYSYSVNGELNGIVYYGNTYRNQIYIDTIRDSSGELVRPISEVMLNDSTFYYCFEETTKTTFKKGNNQTYRKYDYVNGEIVNGYKTTLNEYGDTLFKNYNYCVNKECLEIKHDTLILIDSIINVSANFLNLKYFNALDSSFVDYEYEYYPDGSLKYYNKKRRVHNESYDFMETVEDSLILYANNEGTYCWKKEGELNMIIDGREPNGFYNFKTTKYYDATTFIVEDNTITLCASLLRRLTPYEFGDLGDFVPVSGSFENGEMIDVWIFRNLITKQIVEVKFENGLCSGSFKKIKTYGLKSNVNEDLLAYYQSYDAYKTRNLKYFTYDFELKNDRVIGAEIIRYRGKKVYKTTAYNSNHDYIELVFTPDGDTIESFIKMNATGEKFIKKYSHLGLYLTTENKGDSTILMYLKNDIVDTFIVNKDLLVGITSIKNKVGNKELEYHFDERLSYAPTEDTISNGYSLFLANGYYSIHSLPFIKIVKYENGLKRYAGFFDYQDVNLYNQYDYLEGFCVFEPEDFTFVDTLFTYYNNGNIHEIAVRPYDDYKKEHNYYKELDEKGNVIGDGYFKGYSFEIDCHKESRVYMPDFKVHFLNYFDENGTQTLTNGDGHILRKVNGTPVYEGDYVNEKREGLWKFYDGNGNLTSFGNYIGNKKDGLWYSGDLKHIHFVSECIELTDPNYTEIVKSLENDIRIEKTIYKNGDVIFDERFDRD